MAEVVITEDQPVDDGAAQVAGAAAMASGAALGAADAAGAQAGDAQAQAAQARAEAAAARAEAEQARIQAMTTDEALGTYIKMQLAQSAKVEEPEPVVATAVVEEPAPEGDEPPKSVAKKVQKKTMRERWGG
jgi:hypothetical protein